MDPMDDVKRASLLATDLNDLPDGKDDSQGPPPPDRFGLVGLVILMIGLTSILATTFIVTANDYWMYKFRDPSTETYNLTNKTALQSNFAASLGVAMAVPSIIGLIMAMTVAQRVKARPKLTGTYTILTLAFFLFTLFVKIDTDSWQLGFFIITMGLMGTMAIFFIFLTSSLIVAVPRLPRTYFKLFMYGQGAAGIFSAILQIISLAIGKESRNVALIYFGSGTALYALSLGLYILTKRLPFYQYYSDEEKEIPQRQAPPAREIWRVVKNMWPILAVMTLVVLGQTTTYPNMANLIVSENYDDGSAWSTIYFVPVVTFLVADIANVVGRVFAQNILTRSNYKWHLLINLVRSLIFPPLFAFCNVKGSGSERTVFFPHDWQYAIILIMFVMSGGYYQTVAVLSMPNFREKDEKMDLYYLMMQVIMTIIGLATAPLGILVVNLV